MNALQNWEEAEDKIILTFSAGQQVVDGLEQGDVIVSGITPQTPGGMLLKVDKVTRNGEQVILETTGAAIEEAIMSGRFRPPYP